MDKKHLITESFIFQLAVIIKLKVISIWNKITPSEMGEVKCWTTSTEKHLSYMDIKLS